MRDDAPIGLLGAERDFQRERVEWLVQLRWAALGSALVGALAVWLGAIPGASAEMFLGVGLLGLFYNGVLRWAHRQGFSGGFVAPLTQAMIDIVLLTALLWGAGGLRTPFSSFYIFHVALVAILGGVRWSTAAVAVSMAGAGFLAFVERTPAFQIGVWDPVPPFDVLTEVLAFAMTLAGAAYIVAHAVADIRDREQALETARDRAALEYRLLSNTLDELEAGLEVVDKTGSVVWRNRRAELISRGGRLGAAWECPGASHACEKDASGVCPMASARSEGAPGRCRFAARIEEQEHVYEMLSFPIDEGNHGDTRVMNLYVDRTQTTLAEARLLLAERLASLGRVAQGVAHELNTPLATISTLATDMRSAIATLDTDAVVVEDLDESAALIRDETRRLGQITQALLAGGDLVRARADGAVPLSFAVERARAIVTAGQSEGRVQVEDMTSHQADADGDRLVQVLVNLLQNALDASRESKAEVTVSAIREGGEVEIRIVDGGTGLDPAIEARLFEPFATTKPPGEGTGLGLYMSYMIVRDMGGALSVRNRSDESGTIATVRLPLARRRLEHVAS